jgi:hypothetical protein
MIHKMLLNVGWCCRMVPAAAVVAAVVTTAAVVPQEIHLDHVLHAGLPMD